MTRLSPGGALHAAVQLETPLQIPGAVNANHALLAQRAGFKAIYLSGGGVACVKAGADMVFPEVVTDLSMYRKFADAVKVPVLANITEFGSTPLFTLDELRAAGVGIALYPLSAFRAAKQGRRERVHRLAPRWYAAAGGRDHADAR